MENARLWGNTVFAKEKAINVCADVRSEVSPTTQNATQESLRLRLAFRVEVNLNADNLNAPFPISWGPYLKNTGGPVCESWLILRWRITEGLGSVHPSCRSSLTE